MSVHGEYSRALETLIAIVRALPDAQRKTWTPRLESARVSAHENLSDAAKQALRVLQELSEDAPGLPPLGTSLDGEGGGLEPGSRWHQAQSHLRAHCFVILGKPDPESP